MPASGGSPQGQATRDGPNALRLLTEARLEAAHAGEPAVVVRGLAAQELKHFRVREDQELAAPEALDDRRRDVLGLEHRRRRLDDPDAEFIAAVLEHRGV